MANNNTPKRVNNQGTKRTTKQKSRVKTYNNSNNMGELLKQAGYKQSLGEAAVKGAQQRANKKNASWKDRRHARKVEREALRQNISEARIKADIEKYKARNIAHAITSTSGNIANAITQKNLTNIAQIEQNKAITQTRDSRNESGEERLEAY